MYIAALVRRERRAAERLLNRYARRVRAYAARGVRAGVYSTHEKRRGVEGEYDIVRTGTRPRFLRIERRRKFLRAFGASCPPSASSSRQR